MLLDSGFISRKILLLVVKLLKQQNVSATLSGLGCCAQSQDRFHWPADWLEEVVEGVSRTDTPTRTWTFWQRHSPPPPNLRSQDCVLTKCHLIKTIMWLPELRQSPRPLETEGAEKLVSIVSIVNKLFKILCTTTSTWQGTRCSQNFFFKVFSLLKTNDRHCITLPCENFQTESFQIYNMPPKTNQCQYTTFIYMPYPPGGK